MITSLIGLKATGRRPALVGLFGLCGVAATLGCAAEAPDDSGQPGSTPTAFKIDLAGPSDTEKAAFWFTRLMTHDSASADNAFLNRDDGSHINVSELACFTIGMGGDFCDNDQCSADKVKTRIDANGFYKGRAATYSGQQSKLFWGCTAYSNFLTNAGGVAWISNPDLIINNYGGAGPGGSSSWPGCTANVTSSSNGLWWGSAVSWLGGVGGVVANAFSDFAKVEQSTDGFGSSRLRIGSGGCNGDWTGVQAQGRSFFVGVPDSGQLAFLMGINSANQMVRGHINSPGATWNFTVNSEGGFSSRFLTHVDQGFCGLTYFAGEFAGNGEHVRVAASSTDTGVFWKLNLSKQGGDGVSGSATCIAYDQRG